MMQNHPDFAALWLGFGKIGVSSALLNTNSTGASLVHCVKTVLEGNAGGLRLLVVDEGLRGHVSPDLPELLSLGVTLCYWSCGSAQVEAVRAQRKEGLSPPERRGARAPSDPLLFIFSSGTTGLPKACRISFSRYFLAASVYRTVCRLSETDRVYCVLPLYHSSAGMMTLGSSLLAGSTLVLRKKFSASNFSADCLAHGCTSFVYIGELGRYLVSAPPNNKDKMLKLNYVFGNGMRPEYWEAFKSRYSIKHIVEFYGATEGNIVLINNMDKVLLLSMEPCQKNLLMFRADHWDLFLDFSIHFIQLY
jgi:acyl-CoA synthetase (AMP-forming)/AMP-acid ligase II